MPDYFTGSEPFIGKDQEGISPFERRCAFTGQYHYFKDTIYVSYYDVYIHRSQIESYVESLGLDQIEREELTKELKQL